MSFVPTNPAPERSLVRNDGWYPDLDSGAFMAQTESGTVFGPERINAVILAAMIEINAAIRTWRAVQTAASLLDIPAPMYGAFSEKAILYAQAVFARARAELLATSRDYDSTKDGHNRADKLEAVGADYLRQSAEAVARLTGRDRTIVELI